MRMLLILSVLFLFPVMLGACITLPPTVDVPPGDISFKYEPLGATARQATGVSMAIVKPVRTATSLATFQTSSSNPLLVKTELEVKKRVGTTLDEFLNSIKVDLEKIIIAKGIRTSGPFDDINEMTFFQKREATFALAPEIHLVFDRVITKEAPLLSLSPENKGELSIQGWFSLILQEPLSGQKIWAKKLDIPKRTAPFIIKREFRSPQEFTSQEVTVDDSAKVTAELLQQFYKELMGTIGKHTDPMEFISLKGQAMELKQRAAPAMTQ